MRPSRPLKLPLGLLGASSRIQYQPKGVIEIMVPWNFLIDLTFAPLASALTAGNCSMIKTSEITPETSALIAWLFAQSFDVDEVQVVTGGPEVGAAFSALSFDHLVFTGSTAVGRHVMRAAADNLAPVTLEPGGKSPVIFVETADAAKAATGIMNGKIFNTGQICITPDYFMLPEAAKDTLVNVIHKAVETKFPTGLKDNEDYTSALGQRHFDRPKGDLQDARDKGADVVELNPRNEDFTQQPHHKLPPTPVLNPTEETAVMQEEIFGPILLVRTTSSTESAISYVNDHAHPLALYFFGKSKIEEQHVLQNTVFGGVSVNDTIMHIAQDDLLFGRIGLSGMRHITGAMVFANSATKRPCSAKCVSTCQNSSAHPMAAYSGPMSTAS
ncbi:MAG: aldehyde dehydrogenase family protein [Pikeienuella sp.]